MRYGNTPISMGMDVRWKCRLVRREKGGKVTDFHPRLLSPAPWPPKEGQLVILLGEPKGFVGVLKERKLNKCKVRLLDAQNEIKDYNIKELISTGRTPEYLCSQYKPTPIELSQAVGIERSLPDFGKFRKKSVSKKREPKQISEAQKEFLKRLLVEKLKAVGIKLKET